MKPKTIRTIFIAFLIWLPVQYGLVGVAGVIHSEPWPAFVFPGFKSVYVYESGFEIDQTFFEIYIHEQSEPVVVLPYQLFPELPRSQISGFMRTHFKDPESIDLLSSEGRSWLFRQAQMATGKQPAWLEIVDTKTFYSSGMQELQPDSVAVQFRVTLYPGQNE
jgi:hypothetical protein